MLRTLDRRRTMPDVIHIHSSPTMNAALFREERLALAARHSELQLIENFDDKHGILTVDRLSEACPDWKAREAWVCGPAPMLAAAEQKWEYAKLTRRLHLERFSAVLSTSAEGGRVTFAASGKETEVDGATTLLEAGEAAGIQMPFGCRMGICHTCIVPLKKGMVKDLRNGAEYHENSGVQTCITSAAGDCVLEI
jgi:ferredoxin-NADP reductase